MRGQAQITELDRFTVRDRLHVRERRIAGQRAELRIGRTRTAIAQRVGTPWTHHHERTAFAGEFGNAAGVIDMRMRIENQLDVRSEEHTSALQSLMHISYAVFCL